MSESVDVLGRRSIQQERRSEVADDIAAPRQLSSGLCHQCVPIPVLRRQTVADHRELVELSVASSHHGALVGSRRVASELPGLQKRVAVTSSTQTCPSRADLLLAY